MSATALISKFLLKVLIFSVVLAFAHDLLVRFTSLELSRYKLFEIHVFLAVLTLLSYMALQWVARKNYERAGFAFLGSSLLKMMASLLYLLPMIRSEAPELKSTVLQFLVAYILYLFLEAREVFTLLRKMEPASSNKGE